MSFLINNESENIVARVTNYGRQKISEGDFNIKYFQVGDSEYNYDFDFFDGTSDTYPAQKIFAPFDKDSIVKYPYKLSESTVTGTTFGIPIKDSTPVTIKNDMGPAGFVTGYQLYNGTSGSSIVCTNAISTVSVENFNGSSKLIRIPTDVFFDGCEYITLGLTQLVGPTGLISGTSNSFVYKVIDFTDGAAYNTIEVDRTPPDLYNLGYNGQNVTIICNKCNPLFPDGYDLSYNCAPQESDPSEQQEPWTLNVVWSHKPAGMDSPTSVDIKLSGYTSNVYTSTMEFLGYNISDGQLWNTGTTITNSYGDEIIVPPEEQHSIAILHYTELNNQYEPERYYKYEDYLANQEEEDIDYFEVYIPFIQYHRNTGTTIGARFYMGTEDYYVDSAAEDTKLYKIKYRYLVDEQNIKVGKIFTDKKIIVFDDQELVAVLDYKSNRKYTLPIPRAHQIPYNSTINNNEEALMTEEGQTLYVSYLIEHSVYNEINGLHCNHYTKVTGTTSPSDVAFSFEFGSFNFLQTTTDLFSGYFGNKFKVLAQLVEEGEELRSDGWKVIDFTPELTLSGGLIPSTELEDVTFFITKLKYTSAPYYSLRQHLHDLPIISDPEILSYFGDEQPFPGSIKVTRATDFQMLKFLVNLPEGEFEVTQNPTWVDGKDKRITELALLDENKDVLVIGKCPSPIKRIGTQVFAVKLDF